MEFKYRGLVVVIIDNLVITSKILDYKLTRISVEFDGTVYDMSTKVNRIAKLDNDMYKELSNIQSNVAAANE